MLRMILVLALLWPCYAARAADKAAENKAAKIEFFIAESEPDEGLTKALVPGQKDKAIYLHAEPILTEEDVADARADVDNGRPAGHPARLHRRRGREDGRGDRGQHWKVDGRRRRW